ncbi:MAG: imidazole glycerol phosphate synthase subunit HisH [Turneriella sp.]|nr:imidazole glycerol phosphate synthase subunit HisH [Leptospiraceae bacterium]MCX7632318.1 imidazole glycerol phosphate synthase subunit HisH [Turneriella sp.]
MAKKARVLLLDFGMGNIRSLQKAFEYLGQPVTVSAEARTAESADVLLLPGDGAFARAMEELKERNLLDAIYAAHEKQKILFGVCIGFQLLFESSTEFTLAHGLGLLPGKITRLEKTPQSPVIPHIGWTSTHFTAQSKLGRGLPENAMFYYVHSYALRERHEYATAVASYGQLFTAAIEHENIYAVQFHPEKSHRHGLTLLKNFLDQL